MRARWSANLDRIKIEDIESAYTGASFTGLGAVVVEVEDCSEAGCNGTKYQVEITDLGAGASILWCPIIRFLYPNKDLWGARALLAGTTHGRVAYNQEFLIIEDYRKRGVGTEIYRIEDMLYRSYGAVEIQLVAAMQGRVVWRKRGFIIQAEEMGALNDKYQEWCEVQDREFVKATRTVDFPDDFLLSGKARNIKMYKEIS